MPISSAKVSYLLISQVRCTIVTIDFDVTCSSLTRGYKGLRDLNTARRTITERYLLECNEIFAVCNIGRAVTDEGLQSLLEIARQAMLSNVGIVCTRSDVRLFI